MQSSTVECAVLNIEETKYCRVSFTFSLRSTISGATTASLTSPASQHDHVQDKTFAMTALQPLFRSRNTLKHLFADIVEHIHLQVILGALHSSCSLACVQLHNLPLKRKWHLRTSTLLVLSKKSFFHIQSCRNVDLWNMSFTTHGLHKRIICARIDVLFLPASKLFTQSQLHQRTYRSEHTIEIPQILRKENSIHPLILLTIQCHSNRCPQQFLHLPHSLVLQHHQQFLQEQWHTDPYTSHIHCGLWYYPFWYLQASPHCYIIRQTPTTKILLGSRRWCWLFSQTIHQWKIH